MFSESTHPKPADDASMTCIVLQSCDAAHVRPIGSLDMATAPMIERQLNELIEAGFRRLVVDLGGLSFMDSTGLRLALKWEAAARQDGFEIAFVPGPPAVQRVFEVAGMSDHVPFIMPRAAIDPRLLLPLESRVTGLSPTWARFRLSERTSGRPSTTRYVSSAPACR